MAVVSFALSIVAVCVSLPRTDLGFDYLGLIVGMLSILVTVLLGWQILNRLLFEKRMLDIAYRTTSQVGNKLYKEIQMSSLSNSESSLICYLQSKDWFKVMITMRSMVLPIKEIQSKEEADKLAEWTVRLSKKYDAFTPDEQRRFWEYVEHFKKLMPISDKVSSAYIDVFKSCSRGEDLSVYDQ